MSRALSPPEAVLFDIDGTLIDSNALHVSAWSKAFREGGHGIASRAIASQIGKGGDNLVPALLPHVDRETQQRLTERQGVIFKARYLGEARPFPRAADLLRRVHQQGCKLVLASSAKRDEVEHYADLLGVTDILNACTSADDVDQSKPEPDIFAAALRTVGVEARAALVIGDTIWDVEAAARAELRSVAVLSGGVSAEQLKSAGALAIYRDVGDVLARYDASPLASMEITTVPVS